MKKFDLIEFLMNPKKWWIPLFIIFVASLTGVSLIGIHTYTEAPPLPDYVSPKGEVVFSKEDILKGQQVFQKYALMEYGSMFGDGANRGPDFTAEALHLSTTYMQQYYLSKQSSYKDAFIEAGVSGQVKKEIKSNTYNKEKNQVSLSAAQVYATGKLQQYYHNFFTDPSSGFKVPGYIKDPADLRALSAFFFWGGWVCGVERPGKTYSYTHNWPYDPEAGNHPSGAVAFWSIIGSLGLIIGLGLVLYYHGRMEKLDDDVFTKKSSAFMSKKDTEDYLPNQSQKATYKFFYAAIILLAVQVLAGILTVHDFVGFVNFFGWNISELLPITLNRSWHVQLSLLWISACWIGASFFVMSMKRRDVKHEVALINTIFWLIVLLVAGSFAGIFLGPKGIIGKNWYWWGHQGWEYVELGKLWQVLLFLIFILWAITLYRGVRPVMKAKQPWALPNWLVYATVSIIALLISGFIATPRTNFVIADFWRWCVIHMWAEAFFEVFTTVLVGYFMVMMGLVNKQAAIRVIYLATLMFLGSGLLGISHNFYWNAKPVGTMALGSVFSTLQVVPLVLLTLEAWRFSRLPGNLEKINSSTNGSSFGFREVFLFLVAVNFWNFFGAGVMGFIINLPIANYYEHGTYLTVNHGHAALMGVYGNLALAAVLFCCQLLFKKGYWKPKLLRTAFWSINIGLLLMVLLDLFPAGLYQLYTVMDKGLWYGRSSAFIESNAFQTLTWLRIIGGSIFVIGGVIPLTRFIVGGNKKLKQAFPLTDAVQRHSEISEPMLTPFPEVS
jgi:nitric oxide reductase subunit B